MICTALLLLGCYVELEVDDVTIFYYIRLAFLPVAPSCFHFSHALAGGQPAAAAAAASQ